MKKKVLTIDDANKKLIGQYRDLDKYKHRTEPKRLLKEFKNIHSGEDIWVVAAEGNPYYGFWENCPTDRDAAVTLDVTHPWMKGP